MASGKKRWRSVVAELGAEDLRWSERMKELRDVQEKWELEAVEHVCGTETWSWCG
jgi:hypothetical protein